MEAKIESPGVKYRGVLLTSQNLEEKEILLNIWNNGGRPVTLYRNGGNVCIGIAPTPEEEKDGDKTR